MKNTILVLADPNEPQLAVLANLQSQHNNRKLCRGVWTSGKGRHCHLQLVGPRSTTLSSKPGGASLNIISNIWQGLLLLSGVLSLTRIEMVNKLNLTHAALAAQKHLVTELSIYLLRRCLPSSAADQMITSDPNELSWRVRKAGVSSRA